MNRPLVMFRHRDAPQEGLIPKTHREGALIVVSCALLATAIFVLDVALRLGLAIPIVYIGVIWLAGNSNDKRLTLISAIVCSLLTIGGLFFSPEGPVMYSTVLSNRLLCLFGLWMTTILLVQRTNQQSQLEYYNDTLEETVESRTLELRNAYSLSLRVERLAAIGQMVTGLAHESKNALQRIQSSVNRLYRRVQGDEDLTKIVSDIEQASDDVARLYQEVKSYAAPIVLERKTQSLQKIWNKAWSDLRLAHEGREVAFQEEVGDQDLMVSVDSFRMEQVFRNIFENALSACTDPLELSLRCSEVILSSKPGLEIQIQDNGPGLTEEQKERIFMPFFTTRTKGTGLGMAIVKRIVEAHEGDIFVDSPEGEGAIVVVRIPSESSEIKSEV